MQIQADDSTFKFKQATPPAPAPAASPPVVSPPPYIPPPPPSHNSPPTLVQVLQISQNSFDPSLLPQTVIFDGPKVQAVGTTAHSGSTLPGPPHNGPMGYATWERTLRGAPPPAPPPQVWFSYTQAPNSFQHFRQHRATEAASVPAYPTSVQSPPCQHPPRNPGTLKNQECC